VLVVTISAPAVFWIALTAVLVVMLLLLLRGLL
jgi:hypothetical protein